MQEKECDVNYTNNPCKLSNLSNIGSKYTMNCISLIYFLSNTSECCL